MSRRKKLHIDGPDHLSADVLTVEAVHRPALGAWVMTTTMGDQVLDTRHFDGALTRAMVTRLVEAQRSMVKSTLDKMVEAASNGDTAVTGLPRQHGNGLPPVTVVKR